MAPTVALVTGANQGIGLQTVKRLATEHKDYVVLLAGRRAAAVDEAVAQLRAGGLANVEPLVLDITSDASIAAAVEAVRARHGHLDVLVNNAGISGIGTADTSTAESRRAKWTQVLDTNVTSTAAVTDAFLPLLKAAGAPRRIVFVSSTLGSIGLKRDPTAFTHANIEPTSPYTVSKAALNMLAQHYMVQFEGDPAGWKINCACPGYCSTGLNGHAGTDSPETGSLEIARLAALGPDGETAGFSNRQGKIPW